MKTSYNTSLTLVLLCCITLQQVKAFMVDTVKKSLAIEELTKPGVGSDLLPLVDLDFPFADEKSSVPGLIFDSEEKNPDVASTFLVRKADKEKDLKALVSWFTEDKGIGSKPSKLKSYTAQEIKKYIDKGELFIADASTDSIEAPNILATTIVSWLEEDERDKLIHKTAPIPKNVAEKFPQDLMFVRGTKMTPAFSSFRGKIGNKFCFNLGASFLVETLLESIHNRLKGRVPGSPFALCSGSSLGSLPLLHLHSKIIHQLCRHKLGTKLHYRVIQEHTLPGTVDDQCVMTYAVFRFKTNVAPITNVIRQVGMKTNAGMVKDVVETDFMTDLVRRHKVPFRVLPPTTLVHGKTRDSLIDLVPETLEQAEAAVIAASKHSIPISAMGRGKRWGATKSTEIPSIRLNLKKLNNIPLIDVCNGLIIVEAGTTQGQVADALRGSGWYLPVTGSCRHSSIVGNAIDCGITSAGLRIDQVVGVQAVEWATGEKIRTGALASLWHAAHVQADPDICSSSFLFGKRAAVLKMALSLKRLPKYVSAGVVPGSEKAIKTACSLYNEGTIGWWQLRVEPRIGSIIVVKTEGMHEEMTKFGVKHFLEVLGEKGQLVHYCTEKDINYASIEGEGPFPDFFLKAGMDYFRGEPSCDPHQSVIGTNSCSEAPKDGRGFQLKAFSVPANPSVIMMLRDEVLSVAASFVEKEGLLPTITAVPMSSGGRYNTMYFLVWATYDRKNGKVGDDFFVAVEKIMKAARCPPCRY